MSYIYQQITVSGFRDAFRRCGRAEQFSACALSALFDYLSEIAEGGGAPIELDVIALCCEWSEYADASDAARECGYDDDADDDDADDDAARKWLHDRTTVIEFSGGLLVAKF